MEEEVHLCPPVMAWGPLQSPVSQWLQSRWLTAEGEGVRLSVINSEMFMSLLPDRSDSCHDTTPHDRAGLPGIGAPWFGNDHAVNCASVTFVSYLIVSGILSIPVAFGRWEWSIFICSRFAAKHHNHSLKCFLFLSCAAEQDGQSG